MKKYCQKCGTPADKLANFCGGCGNSFKTTLSNPTPARAAALEVVVEEGEGESVPAIEGLEVEFSKPVLRRETYGDVLKNAISDPTPHKIERPSSKISKKKIAQIIRDEGGNSQQSVNVGGET